MRTSANKNQIRVYDGEHKTKRTPLFPLLPLFPISLLTLLLTPPRIPPRIPIHIEGRITPNQPLPSPLSAPTQPAPARVRRTAFGSARVPPLPPPPMPTPELWEANEGAEDAASSERTRLSVPVPARSLSAPDPHFEFDVDPEPAVKFEPASEWEVCMRGLVSPYASSKPKVVPLRCACAFPALSVSVETAKAEAEAEAEVENADTRGFEDAGWARSATVPSPLRIAACAVETSKGTESDIAEYATWEEAETEDDEGSGGGCTSEEGTPRAWGAPCAVRWNNCRSYSWSSHSSTQTAKYVPRSSSKPEER
ncbi:hypothetical protein B0H13DRAFT_2679495 [Mycena leptocephala]|nr:hypothetical protein B0H13DRAFT_2679495 [Mycena leptocephala]